MPIYRIAISSLLAVVALAAIEISAVPVAVLAQEKPAAEERAAQLTALFADLAGVTTVEQADATTARIWDVWLRSGDPEIDRGMRQAVFAMKLQRYTEALVMFDKLVELAPGNSEAWNKRATVNYLIGRHDASLADIEQTLELEPRHFGALSGRALILTSKGDRKGAIMAMEQALRINPFVRGAKDIIERNGGRYDPGRRI